MVARSAHPVAHDQTPPRYHRQRRLHGRVGRALQAESYRRGRRLLPGKKIVWQFKKGIRLPVWLSLTLEDDAAGVSVTHTVRAGFDGLGRILDPIFRVYFSAAFTAALDEHVKVEFPKLRELLTAHSLTDQQG